MDYRYLLNPEPASREKAEDYVYVDGSIGKILPGIVVKGEAAHVVSIMKGLNSTLIASNIARRIELNTDFISSEFGKSTPPPAVLYMKDSKKAYDVSLPLFTDIYAHIPVTKNRSLPQCYQELKEVCRSAAQETLKTFKEAYERVSGSMEGCPDFIIDVMTYSELEEICRRKNADYEEKKAAFSQRLTREVRCGELLIQDAGFRLIHFAIEESRINHPLVIIGLLPPYVPAVNNHYMQDFDREGMIKTLGDMLKREFGMGLEEDPYTMGMSDNSYTGCTEVETDKEAMRNMVAPEELYSIPFGDIEKIAVPSVLLGPWGKDYHTAAERVYLPDIERVTPAVISEVIKNI